MNFVNKLRISRVTINYIRKNSKKIFNEILNCIHKTLKTAKFSKVENTQSPWFL